MVLWKDDIHMQKNETRPQLRSHTKINGNLNLRASTKQLLEETIGINLDLGLSNVFLDMILKALE